MLNHSLPVSDLPPDWYETICKAAGFSAKMKPGRSGDFSLSHRELHEAAMNGIIQYLAEHGWTDNFRELLNAADMGIWRESYDAKKHYRNAMFWTVHTSGHDPVADLVVDRIAVRQLLEAFTPYEKTAIITLAGTLDRGGRTAAAELLGISLTAMDTRLKTARQRARNLWGMPGETIRPYHADTKASHKRYADDAKQRRIQSRHV